MQLLIKRCPKFYLIILICFLLLLFHNSYANEKASTLQSKKKYQDAESGSILFLPQVGLQIEMKAFSENDAHYKMETSRIIDLDILRYRNFVLSMFVNEIINYDDRGPDYINPNIIRYEMDFGSLGWELKYGVLSWFFDHNCNNVINENDTEEKRLRWYGTGIRWESYGMRPGRKNAGNNDNNSFLLKNLNYKISAGRAIHTRYFNYNLLITGVLRYDLLSNYFLIPYIEGSFTSLIDTRVRFNRYYEAGLRMRFSKGDLTPFLGINHRYDTDYYNGTEADLYYAGFRMETLVTKHDEPGQYKSKSLFPDFHLSGSYAKYINDKNLNFNTDILFGVDFLNSFKTSPFVNYQLIHNSLAKHSGMYPRYMQQNIETGISHMLTYPNIFIEPHYVFRRFDEGNFFNGYSEYANIVVLRVSSIEMKTGYANNGIEFNKSSPHWLNRIDWMLSAGRTFDNHKYEYTWEYNVRITWNILRYHNMIPYISVDMSLLEDDNYDEIYNAEPGIRIQSGLYWMLFYRYEYRTAVDEANGFYRDYHLAGIRVEI